MVFTTLAWATCFTTASWDRTSPGMWGTTRLGAETMGPIVTRGVLVDVVGFVAAEGRSEAYEIAPTGRPMLRSNYRITVEDIESTLAWEA